MERKAQVLVASAGALAGLGLALGLSAGAVQDGGAAAPDLSAQHLEVPPVNRPPTLGVQGGAVRAGESLTLAAYATDMESDAIHLSVLLDLRPGQSAPAWLERRVWTADLAAQPILRIPVSPPAGAKPGTHSFLVGATDSGGLTSWRRMFLEVLPPAEPASAASGSGGGASVAGASGSGASKTAFGKAAAPPSSATDSPSLNLSVSPASMAEGSSGDIVVSATLMGVSMVPGVDVVGALQVSGTATDGTDYSLSGTRSVIIPAGSATLTGTRTLRLTAKADEQRREDDETVKFKVTQVTRGTEVLALSSVARTSVTITNVYAKPPKVSGVSAEAASEGALRVAWDAPAASPALTRQFVQHRRDDKPDGDWTRQEVSGSAVEALVTGLQPGRRYDVRVRARNKVGKGDWSDEATANTAPTLTVSAEDDGVASIGEGNAPARIRLTGSAKAKGGGTLTGRWLRVFPNPSSMQDEIVLPSGPSFSMVSKQDYQRSLLSDTPKDRTYRLRVTHELSGERTVAEKDVAVSWLPKVVLSASPSSVAEDGGARTVEVKAKLTGKAVGSESKSVSVKVKGGTATEGTDFAAVSGFTISIPGGSRSATGRFRLTPTADSAAEGGETVKVKGSATEGTRERELKVKSAEVTIEDERVTLTVSPVPTNGSVTGTGVACGTGTSGDCSETVTKSASVSLTASPSAGYVFKEWSGACSSEKGASCAVMVSGATTVGASFRLPKVKVKVEPAAGGSVTGSGIDCGAGTTSDCSERVSGGTIALTASPASGYAVGGWSGGGCSGTGTTCTASVTADVTVKVTFTQQPAPSAPSGLAATPGAGQVTLSWTDPGNAAITGYEVRYKAGSGAYGTWADISGSGAGTTSHRVTGLANGTAHTFQLRAESASGPGASAEVSATPSRAPLADAGLDQRVSMGAVVTLDGSGSSEPDGETLTYAWSQTSGTTVTLSAAAASQPTFRAPSDAAVVSESLGFSLKVSDPHRMSDTDAVTVTAENQAPTASAGDDQSVAKGSAVTLDGGGSDPEGGGLTYAWSQTAGATVTLSSTTALQPTFTAPGADGTLSFSLTATDPADLAGTDAVTVTVENQPPTANVADQSVAKGSTVTLDGSGSSDPENGTLTYAWSQTAGATVTLSSTTAVKPTFTAPGAEGTLTFGLRVTDPLGLTGTDTGTVRVENQAPTAVVPDQSVAKGSTVTLDGSGSSDPENGTLTYRWSQTAGATVTLSSTTASKPTFTAPSADVTLTFSLRVTDPQGLSGTDTGTVRVENQAPTAVVPDQSVAKGSTVTLDGSGSSDPENGTLTYRWSQTAGATVTLSSTAATKPTFTAPSADVTLKFGLRVTDPLGLTGTDTGMVRVENQAPTAVVPDQNVAKGSTVTLDGSGSSDPENGTLTYRWSQTAGATVTLSSTTAAKPTFTVPNNDGTLKFSLTVTDPQGLEGVDTGTVTVVSKYALTISPAPANGSVTGTGIACGAGTTGDCAELVDPGTSVELTATPAANYVVGAWSVAGCSDGAATCTVVMDAARTVGVTFAKPVLTISPVPTNGSVTGTGIACGAGTTGDCSEAFNAGTKVTLTASPAANHAVKSWSGGSCSGDGGTCEVTVGANTTVGVTFGKPTLRVSPKPTRGYVTGNGINCGSGTGRTTCSVTLNSGTGVSLTAAANTHYDFGSWSGGCSGTSSPCAFNLTKDTTVGANFSAATAYGTDSIYLLASAKPDKPTGGTRFSHHLPSGGWTRTLPTPTLQQPVYRTQRTVTYIGGVFSRASAWGDVKKHKYRDEEQGHLYKKTANQPDPPSGGTRNANHRPSGWKTTPDEPTLTEAVWRTQRTVTYEYTLRSYRDTYSKSFRSATAWGIVGEYSWKEKDFAYKQAANKPQAPTGDMDIDRVPNGWEDTAPKLSAARPQPVWQTDRVETYEALVFKSATAWGSVTQCSSAVEEHIYKRQAIRPSAPSGGTNIRDHTPSNWNREHGEVGQPTEELTVYRATRRAYFNCDESFAFAAVWGSVEEYSWKEKDFAYKQAANKPQAPTGDMDIDRVPNGWEDTAPKLSAARPQPIWQTDRVETYEALVFKSATAWGSVTQCSSAVEEHIYKRQAIRPSAPSGGTNIRDHTPSNWNREHGEVGQPTEELTVYRATRRAYFNCDESFAFAAVWGSVEEYSWKEKDFAYKQAANKPQAPTGDMDIDRVPNGWEDTAPKLSAARPQPVWQTDRVETYEALVFKSATAWGSVTQCSSAVEEHIYKRQAIRPSAPSGGTNIRDHTPSNWNRDHGEVGQPTEELTVYRATRRAYFNCDESFAFAAVWGSVEEYSWKEKDFAYKQAANKPATPSGGAHTKDHQPMNWERMPPTPSVAQSVWRAERVETYEALAFKSATAWGGVKKYSEALSEHIYKLAASEPSAPSGGTNNKTHTPSGWQRTQPTPTATENAYRAERILYYEDSSFTRAGKWGGVTKVGSALSVNAGGPYTAAKLSDGTGPNPVIQIPPLWLAEVTASASGGAGSYTFRWQGKSKDGNPARYVFFRAGTYTRSVTVTDANRNQKTSDDPAEIICSPSGGAGGSSDGEGVYIRVPLGGTLDIVWANGGLVSVSSKDAGVATASASGDEITVTGVSVGETDIVVQAGGVEYWMPIRVEDG